MSPKSCTSSKPRSGSSSRKRPAATATSAFATSASAETWVVETEWMQRPPATRHPGEEPVGHEAGVYAARILWDHPNLNWDRN